MVRSLPIALALTFVLARSCGFTPDDRRGEGEPCTRTTVCEVALECRGGVCMRALPDGGVDASTSDASTPLDASAPRDASTDDASAPRDAAGDASSDGG